MRFKLFAGYIVTSLLSGFFAVQSPLLAAEESAPPAAAPAREPGSAVSFGEVEKLAKTNPDLAIDVYRMAGQWCINHNHASKAPAFYLQALRVQPGDLKLLEELSEAQMAAGMKEEGLATWDELLTAKGKDVGFRARYANVLVKAGLDAKAIEVARAIAAERPEEPSMRYWMADAYQRIGKNAEAVKELQAIAKDFPGEKNEVERRIGRLRPEAAKPEPAGRAQETVERKSE